MKSFYSKLTGIVMFSFIATLICMQSATAMAASTGGMITGKVTKSDGVTPIGGCDIVLFIEGAGRIGSTTTGPDGKFIISGLASGNYDITCFKNGFITADKYNISVANNKVTTSVDFALFKKSSIKGVVSSVSSEQPINAAEITLCRPNGLPEHSTLSNDEGKYELTVSYPGEYVLKAKKEGYAEYRSDFFELDEGEHIVRPDIALLAGGTIKGRVFEKGTNTPLQDAIILLLSEYGLEKAYETDVDGNYIIMHLPNGNYGIALRTENHKPDTLEFTIEDNNTIIKDFYLNKDE